LPNLFSEENSPALEDRRLAIELKVNRKKEKQQRRLSTHRSCMNNFDVLIFLMFTFAILITTLP